MFTQPRCRAPTTTGTPPAAEVEALGAAAPPHDVRAARQVDLQQHAAAERREPRVLDADRAGVHRLGANPLPPRPCCAATGIRPSRGAVKQQGLSE